MTKTQWITRTAICLALLVCVQFVTKSLNQQLITGSCVNLILAVTALAVGAGGGVIVAVVSPFLAFLLGIGPKFIQLVPCIAAGNAVYVVLLALLLPRFMKKAKALSFGAVVIAAAVKFLALWLLVAKLVAPLVVPEAKLAAVAAMFTWPQLATALIGGCLATVVYLALRRAQSGKAAK